MSWSGNASCFDHISFKSQVQIVHDLLISHEKKNKGRTKLGHKLNDITM